MNTDNTFDNRIQILGLIAELCRIYAQDSSEKANIAAINTVQRSFSADAVALFYVSVGRKFRVCLAGTNFPIALGEVRWRNAVEPHAGPELVTRFGTWSIPGIERALPHWISARLYSAGDEGAYLFLGREDRTWSEAEVADLEAIRNTIAPIVEVRKERDIEEHRRLTAELLLATNESRLRNLFEGSRDMMYTADAMDRISSVNMAGVNLLGYTSKTDLVGQDFASFIMNPDYRGPFIEDIRKKGYVDEYEIVLTKKDGTSIFCLETAHAVKDSQGNIQELLGIVKDITERIERERDLWKTNFQLAEANMKLKKTQILMVQNEKMASIGLLAAGIAHEINNPLGFLISNHNFLKKASAKVQKLIDKLTQELGPVAETQAAIGEFQRILSEVATVHDESSEGYERIKKIVSSLKNFSRIDGGSSFDSFDVNAGIESTLVVAWNEIKYVSEVRKDLQALPLIRANGSEINQVLLNIIVNAAQALSSLDRPGKSVIEVRTRVEGENVLISIKDDGPGIPEAIRNKIFAPFFTTKDPGKGTGLGLSISYDIVVHKHHGSLWVESGQGTGTTFFLLLPIAGPPDTPSPAPDR